MKLKIFLVFSCALLFISCEDEMHHTDATQYFEVTTPIKKDTVIFLEYVAQIKAIQHIELRAFEEGYLQKVYIDEGKSVKKGQLLFQLQPTILNAEKMKAEAEYKKALLEYQNTKLLSDNEIVSQNELAISKANLDMAKAEFDLAVAHLRFTQIEAPFGGIIGRFNDVRQGSLLEEGELLTTLSDNSKTWVYFNVPEKVYLEFMRTYNPQEEKQEVYLQLADGQIYEQPGIVETIESDFNNETGNIAFRATFNNPNTYLRHGQTGKILMPHKLKNAILIPQKATYEVLNKKFVYVVKNGVVEAREIFVENEIPHLYVVSKGLTVNDTVLVDGLRKVQNGDTIKVEYNHQSEILKKLIDIKAE